MNFFQEHYAGVSAMGTTIALLICAGLGYWAFAATTQLRTDTARFEAERADLSTRLALLEEENNVISEALYSEKRKNDEFEEQIERIADTVGVLEKLSQTDAELLQKYSKVFFLNEHYSPSKFKEIDSKWRFPENKVMHVHADVYPFLEDLLRRAERDNIDIRVVSAYRSFNEQTSLKSHYTVTYGSGANTFSADQGYSEHQLGTTVDFSTAALNGSLTNFQTTEAYDWLRKNAHRYGFVLSYPEGNAYYQFEPWHWRFVGRALARELDRKKMYFYDMDQRDIDEYLVEFFD